MKKLLVATAIAMMAIPFAHAADTPADATLDASQASFTQIDADQDGTISKQEASSFSSVEVMFDGADANKDGTLDSAEFEKANTPAEAATN